MERIKPRTLSGFAELLPEQQLQFQAVMATLEQVYRQDRKSTRLNSSHNRESRMPSSA